MGLHPVDKPEPKGEERPAARLTDQHLCIKHGGGGPINSASPNVYVNSLKFARVSDTAQCIGNDYIVTGSATVRVNGKPAARVKSKTMHPGYVSQGSNNVLVGGPDAGGTLGNADKAKDRCKELSQSRVSGNDQQSFGDCSLESPRLLIHQATGSDVSELGLMGSSIMHGDSATGLSGSFPNYTWNQGQAGGTMPENQGTVLSRWGVDNSMMPATPDNITQSVADGKGLTTSHDAGGLWNDSRYNGGGHTVVPTGLEYDENGKLTHVHTVDSGQGDCDRVVPADNYMKSLYMYPNAPVTKNKIW